MKVIILAHKQAWNAPPKMSDKKKIIFLTNFSQNNKKKNIIIKNDKKDFESPCMWMKTQYGCISIAFELFNTKESTVSLSVFEKNQLKINGIFK